MIEIDENAAGQRIDNFLLRVCKGVPKSHIYRILRSGEVRVNKGRIDASVNGNTITLTTQGPNPRSVSGELALTPAQWADRVAAGVGN